MAVKLIKSDRVIQALKPGSQRLNDGGGLHLLPFANGMSHYWRLDYTFEGKRKTLSLGVYPKTGLAEARSKAEKAWASLAMGVNPSQERQAQRTAIQVSLEAEQRQQKGLPAIGTFEEVARRWFSVKKSQWMETYSSKVIRRLELHGFPQFGNLALSVITPKTVLAACRRVEDNDTLETAHRLREHCSSVFRFAIAEGADLRDPCQDIRDALKKPAVCHFGAVTNPDVLAEMLRAIDAYRGSLVVRTALQLATMLMVRPGELRLAKWDEFDLDNGLWYIPSMRMKRTKEEKENGQPHLVPLPKQAVGLLESLFMRTGSTGQTFPAEGRAGRFMSENTLNVALRAMGYASDEATAHGFRATARTMIVELLQFPESVVEMQLAHAVKDANGTAYNRTEFLKKRFEMMQAWADYLDDLRLGRSKIVHPVLPKFNPVSRRLQVNQLAA
ncbi:tyrosine-type recombinase/integrase [Rhodoferax sp. U2-2l]|uniref:tyrosine-type recombinase/integrase n=1 Tax=Rhodoferax sp. U2-2l TaxID=2884000 RepID=UPI001D0B9247|nr:integrase arm-type DNA-binding domain-containing protein [Rhodoferax sp. U2-2l]MCB8748939.1 tyrosine-type recombinase/integrase [Rhodoferax sp. U2-2l]